MLVNNSLGPKLKWPRTGREKGTKVEKEGTESKQCTGALLRVTVIKRVSDT